MMPRSARYCRVSHTLGVHVDRLPLDCLRIITTTAFMSEAVATLAVAVGLLAMSMVLGVNFNSITPHLQVLIIPNISGILKLQWLSN